MANLSPTKKRNAFLVAYAIMGNVTEAATEAGVSRRTILRWRKAYPQFDKACDEALESNTDLLIGEAIRRGLNKSDNLLMFLIKQRNPTFRDNYRAEATVNVELTTNTNQEIGNAIANRRAELQAEADC